MFRAIMNIKSFCGDSKMSVWLCQIAKNLYFEWLKKSRRTVPIDENTADSESDACVVSSEQLKGKDIAEEVADKD